MHWQAAACPLPRFLLCERHAVLSGPWPQRHAASARHPMLPSRVERIRVLGFCIQIIVRNSTERFIPLLKKFFSREKQPFCSPQLHPGQVLHVPLKTWSKISKFSAQCFVHVPDRASLLCTQGKVIESPAGFHDSAPCTPRLCTCGHPILVQIGKAVGGCVWYLHVYGVKGK